MTDLARPTADVLIDGRTLSLADVHRVAYGAAVGLAPEARARMEASRRLVEAAVEKGEVVYGVTTGFGRLADTLIPAHRIRELQLNLVRSHAVGVGEPFAEPAARAITLLRANTLAGGHGGVRPVVCERLLELLDAGVWPRIPSQGSVGASGDLAPLAHLALVAIGEGEAFYEGIEKALKIPGVHIHLYGKTQTKPFRKMGHVTVIGKEISEVHRKANQVLEILKVKAF